MVNFKDGAPYIEFAVAFRAFLKHRKYQTPMDFWHDLRAHMGKNAPSKSGVYMAFYGVRALPSEVVWFMHDRYGFDLEWHQLLPARDRNGEIKKSNQLSLPGIREMKR